MIKDLIIILSLFLIGQSTYAKLDESKLKECQSNIILDTLNFEFINPIERKISEQIETIKRFKLFNNESDTKSETRTSVIGALFTKDTSNPKLGDAYRDPYGLIWGEPASYSYDKRINQKRYDLNNPEFNFDDAVEYCKSIGARLPTRVEYERLAYYMGLCSEQGYSKYQADSDRELLPKWSSDFFWTSTPYENKRYHNFYTFESALGLILDSGPEHPLRVRCVSDNK